MMTDARLHKSLWITCIALTMMAVGMLADAKAQDMESTSVNRKEVTAEFSYLPLGTIPAIYQIAGMTFFAHSSPVSAPAIADRGTPAERGYAFPATGVTVVLPREARAVKLRLCLAAADVTVQTLNASGTLLEQRVVEAANACGDLSLSDQRIAIVRFMGGSNQASLVRLSAISGWPPMVYAGADQTVAAGQIVILAGAALDLDGGSIASYAWTQTDVSDDGTTVLLRSADRPMAMFSAPDLSEDETLTFRLTVTDDDGETASSHVRVTVTGWGGVFTEVGAGENHTCAVRDTGAVECWGDNTHGRSTPPAGTFISVSAGYEHTCAVRDTGAVECWGASSHNRTSPPEGTYTSVGAGQWHSCAVAKSTGAVACWGWNDSGRLSPPAGKFASISAGREHTCGLRDAGAVACWGHDGSGRSTHGHILAVSVSAGWGAHTCAVARDTGRLECWGSDSHGQAKPPLGTFDSVSAGERYTCGVRPTGAVECWGNNEYGRSTPPVGVFDSISIGGGAGLYACGLRDTGAVACWGQNNLGQATPPAGTYTSVSGGYAHTCAVRDTGAVACWGSNQNGRSTPPVGTYTSVSAGGWGGHTCAVREDTGAVACWGFNRNGQATPPAGAFVSVEAGHWHTCGVRTSDSMVACWGRWAYGVDAGDW